jgi:hypothetical protein
LAQLTVAASTIKGTVGPHSSSRQAALKSTAAGKRGEVWQTPPHEAATQKRAASTHGTPEHARMNVVLTVVPRAPLSACVRGVALRVPTMRGIVRGLDGFSCRFAWRKAVLTSAVSGHRSRKPGNRTTSRAGDTGKRLRRVSETVSRLGAWETLVRVRNINNTAAAAPCTADEANQCAHVWVMQMARSRFVSWPQ